MSEALSHMCTALQHQEVFDSAVERTKRQKRHSLCKTQISPMQTPISTQHSSILRTILLLANASACQQSRSHWYHS